MSIGHKQAKVVMIRIAYSYLIACYPTFAASWLVPNSGNPDAIHVPWVNHAIGLVFAPVTAPLAIYFCGALTFAMGVIVFPEGLIPAAVFLGTFSIAWFLLGCRAKPQSGEPGATPNGGPAAPVDNSKATEGPPSVS